MLFAKVWWSDLINTEIVIVLCTTRSEGMFSL